MNETLLLILIDFLLAMTGAFVLWVLSFGRFKLLRPARVTLTYFCLSFVGAAFWVAAIFILVKVI